MSSRISAMLMLLPKPRVCRQRRRYRHWTRRIRAQRMPGMLWSLEKLLEETDAGCKPSCSFLPGMRYNECLIDVRDRNAFASVGNMYCPLPCSVSKASKLSISSLLVVRCASRPCGVPVHFRHCKVLVSS